MNIIKVALSHTMVVMNFSLCFISTQFAVSALTLLVGQ